MRKRGCRWRSISRPLWHRRRRRTSTRYPDCAPVIRQSAAARGFAIAPEPFHTALFYDFEQNHEHRNQFGLSDYRSLPPPLGRRLATTTTIFIPVVQTASDP